MMNWFRTFIYTHFLPRTTTMASPTALCRLRVRNPSRDSEALLSLDETTDIHSDRRLQWSKAILREFAGAIPAKNYNAIREWDFVLHPNGTVENRGMAQITTHASSYPPPYQVPDARISHVNDAEKTRRKELFAIGGLLYELASTKKPFHDSNEETVTSLYADGKFPDDVWSLPNAVSILSCWCSEFEDQASGLLPSGFRNYVKEHPMIMFTAQAIGVVAAVGSLATIPTLGVVGFAATGPVAGTLAAGWQSSLGLVQAGGLFAWCQSAAMGGGAAAATIATTGVSGSIVAAGTTAFRFMDSKTGIPPEVLKERFLLIWSQPRTVDLHATDNAANDVVTDDVMMDDMHGDEKLCNAESTSTPKKWKL